ncbi:putative aldehyde dehydrogenase [Pseudomonas aeruginosa MH38]|nr:putative aldehyde dehydrogenase [Pseudomonas aeruginosa MH38]
MISSPSSAVKPRYRPRASRANAAAPAASCACSPKSCGAATSMARASTAPGPNASRCHASTCASAGSASARWRCSARATSPWRSPPPAAIPPRPWPPAARWCSRRTGGHMATAERVAAAILRAAERTGMPAGVFNMIYGGGVGERLVRHPAIQAVGFTGSLKGGRALCDMAAARAQPIPVFAEMSSINPVVLLPAALKKRGEAVADELSASVVLGCGQFCTNPGLVIGIRSAQFSAFLERFAARMDDQPAQTMLNAGTLASYEKGLAALHAHPRVRHLAGQPQEGRQARPQLFQADVSLLLEGDELLQEEVFGPASVVVEVADHAELKRALHGLHGQLTATLIAEAEDLASFADLVPLLEQKAGRLLLNGYPTGVEVCDAMVHGGPYPATSDARGTSVGTLAIDRFLRPVCYQNYPDAWLPEALKDGNPLGIARLVDGVGTRAAID